MRCKNGNVWWNLIWSVHTRKPCQHGTYVAPRHFRPLVQRIIAVRNVQNRLVPTRARLPSSVNDAYGHCNNPVPIVLVK